MQFTLANLKGESITGKALLLFFMVSNIMVSLKTEIITGKVLIYGRKEKYIRVNTIMMYGVGLQLS